MKRSAGAFSSLLICAACGSGGDGMPPPPDAGPALPDATVIVPTFDAGLPDSPFPEPTVTNVSPGAGPETGGSRVTIRGTSFLEPAEVFFDGVAATNVVVLDQVSIAATTPAGAIGRVTVEVKTPGGTAELPEGYEYILDFQVTAVEPARLPEEGGVPITVRGKGFDDDTLILFDRTPLVAAVLVDSETITGLAPAVRPGRPEIWGLNRQADVRRSDLVVYYATPEIAAVAPGYGPTTGGVRQTVRGGGFDGAQTVTLGGSAATELTITSGTELTVMAPALTEGLHDISVANADASGTRTGVYIAYDPARVGREILGVVPNRVTTDGGEVVTIVGYGFEAGATVSIGGTTAIVDRVEPNAVTVTVPAGLAEGLQGVTVTTGGTDITRADALTVFAPMSITSITPASGPASGGTDVTIAGSGFTAGAEVTIGGVALTDVVITATQITGKTVAGPHGAQDVVVKAVQGRAALPEGFAFIEAHKIIRLDPIEGSIAGNTYVSVVGRGLSYNSTVTIDGESVFAQVLENGSLLSFRTLPTSPGFYDVEITDEGGGATFPQGYSFYDPRIITGGAWGGPISGSVNVGVLDIASGMPLPGMVVQLGYEQDLRYAAVTDANGLATISWPEVRGPRTVTVGRTGFEFVTFQELGTRNLTVLTSRYPASMNPDDPLSPCPMGGEGPAVQGVGVKLKTGLDPVTRPGWRPLARCTYTWRNLFSPNPPRPPTQTAIITRDGQPFVITPARAGTIAVYCVLGDFNESTQVFEPRRMGIARQVPSAPGMTISDITIAFDIELDQQIDLRLDNPPEQVPGPTVKRVQPFLNLGSEGVIPLNWANASGTSNTLTVKNMPNLPGGQFFYRVGSYTDGPNGPTYPYSEVIAQSGADFDVGVDVGPFVQMPENVQPKVRDVLYDGRMTWSQPGITPNVVVGFVLDSTFVSGACCVDTNMNGVCEEGEPVMGGGLPQQFRRWSWYGSGGQSYRLPQMPGVVKAFETPRSYTWAMFQGYAPRFDYREFIWNQFSQFFWRSWSLYASQFVAKEETAPPANASAGN